jgi:hypothetical protein
VYASVSGVVSNVNLPGSTFHIDADQYTTAISKDLKTASSPAPRSFFPVKCFIPDSPRWQQDKKPIPRNNRLVTVEGHVTGIEFDETTHRIARFLLKVDNIAFLSWNNGGGTPTTFADSTTLGMYFSITLKHSSLSHKNSHS